MNKYGINNFESHTRLKYSENDYIFINDKVNISKTKIRHLKKYHNSIKQFWKKMVEYGRKNGVDEFIEKYITEHKWKMSIELSVKHIHNPKTLTFRIRH